MTAVGKAIAPQVDALQYQGQQKDFIKVSQRRQQCSLQ